MTHESLPPAAPWSCHAEHVLESLGVEPRRGLDAATAAARLARYGPNVLRETRRVGAARILAAQLDSPVVGLLVLAATVSFLFGSWAEGLAVVAALTINTAIGFATELRAVRSMEALRKLGSVESRVRRDGGVRTVPARELVPGDIVPLEQGDVVTADLRLVEANLLEADESTLTGESLPVAKDILPVAARAVVAERPSMLFKGTAITRGSGEGVVVATGMDSELGRIARLTSEAESDSTPLEQRLDRLGRRLIWATLAIAAATTGIGVAAGRDVLLMVETGIALAVAAIPEGLPIVATLALARGIRRMAQRHALINRLAAVETLGATSIILTDKTGTLTENRMTLEHLRLSSNLYRPGAWRHGGEDDPRPAGELRAALEVAALCSNASLGSASRLGGDPASGAVGDPLEVALLAAAAEAGIHRDGLLATAPEQREEAFDRSTQMMATFHRHEQGWRVAVKGAAERVLAASATVRADADRRQLTDRLRRAWEQRNVEMAGSGMRVIGLAEKLASSLDEEPYHGLTFLGLAGLRDPPRKDVGTALEACRRAGIRVAMVTGDHAATAAAVAREIGLVDGDDQPQVVIGGDLPELEAIPKAARLRLRRVQIFARMAPVQKLDLIALHQQCGEIVAMTGDGVNDAPALRKADIGIAMGQRGTQVAREAADMVLLDDAFASIVAAIEQGRVIFGNIRRFVYYLLSCNISEVMIVAGATMLSAPLPILPLQILFLNLVTDVFPALALGLGEGDEGVMAAPPRSRDESLLTRRHWLGIAGFALVITCSVLAALFVARVGLGFDDRRAVTVSFLTLALAQLWHVFSMRDSGSNPWRNQVTTNPWVWGALALCLGLLLAAVHAPVLAEILGVSPPGWRGWAVACGLSCVPWLVGLAVLRPRHTGVSRFEPHPPELRALYDPSESSRSDATERAIVELDRISSRSRT